MQNSFSKDTQIKVYKAYPTAKDWLLLTPWFLLSITIVGFSFSTLIYGNYIGENARIIYFLSAIILLIAVIPSGLIIVHISWTSISLHHNGISYRGCILTPMRSNFLPLRVQKTDIPLKWAEIKSVSWENEENKMIVIETKIGRLTFEVFRQPEANAEIMRELKTHEHEFAKGAIRA